MSRRLCLITGASAGIGAAFARIYAGNGFDVALTARRGDRLEALADEIRLRSGVETLTIVADLAEDGAVDAILGQIEANGRQVDALVNNAGYGPVEGFMGPSWSDHQTFLKVMVEAMVETTHKVLPGMIERKYGRIVNVASLAAFLPGSPTSTLYGPAKAFAMRFSQGLHNELRYSGVHVSALCPGMTYSEFHDARGRREAALRRVPEWAWMGADEVAAAGYEAAEANRPVCTPGAPNQVLATLLQWLPDEWAMAVIRRQFRGGPR